MKNSCDGAGRGFRRSEILSYTVKGSIKVRTKSQLQREMALYIRLVVVQITVSLFHVIFSDKNVSQILI